MATAKLALAGKAFLQASGMDGLDQYARTPPALYKALDDEFHFDFDPCPVAHTEDGLTRAWGSMNYVNPPYNDISSWVSKAVVELALGRSSVFLIPCRFHTKYHRDFIQPFASEIRFIDRDVTFLGYDKPLRLPIAVIVFRATRSELYRTPNATVRLFSHPDRTIASLRTKLETLLDIRFQVALHDAGRASSVLETTTWGEWNFICTRFSPGEYVQRCKVLAEAETGMGFVLVIPARAASSWFRQAVAGKTVTFHMINPYLCCEGYSKPSPHPSMIVMFGSAPNGKTLNEFSEGGPVVTMYTY